MPPAGIRMPERFCAIDSLAIYQMP